MKSSSRSKGRVITVKVTQKNIAKGLAGKCEKCPIALALIRRPNYKRVLVSDTVFVETHAGRYFEGILPRRASNFINRFDEGKTVKPFEFRLLLEASLPF